MKIWIALAFATLLVFTYASQLATAAPGMDEDVYRRLEALEAQMSELRRLPADNYPPANYGHALEIAGCDDCQAACPPENEYPSVRVTGFFQLDAGYYHQDAINRTVLGDIEDGLGFRRARLAATGNVATDISYIIEFDIAQAQARFVDVWMQFHDTPLGNIRIGRYRQPFGMAELTSIRELPFIERPVTFALAPFRQTGLMLFDHSCDERMTWAISGYRYLSDNFGNVYSDTGGYGASTRLTYLPIDRGDDRLVHVGVDYSFNDPGRGLVQFATSNEFFVGQNPNLGPGGLSVLPLVGVPPFVNTGAIPTNHTHLFNIEGAATWGRLVVQSEARWAKVDQVGGATNTFPGAYAHMRYVLTGENIPYIRSAGVFGRVKPNAPLDLCCGQWGAWEIAARWSYLDLNGNALPGPGRSLTDLTAGLNWYLNDHTKFQFNWIHSDLSDPVLGDSTADTLAMRGQIDF